MHQAQSIYTLKKHRGQCFFPGTLVCGCGFCFALHARRMSILKQNQNKHTTKTKQTHKPKKKTQTKNQLIDYICGRKVCQGQFSGCRYSKAQKVLKLQLSREYLEDRITLCLFFSKHPLLAVTDWPFLAPCLATLTFLSLYPEGGRQAWVIFSPFTSLPDCP